MHPTQFIEKRIFMKDKIKASTFIPLPHLKDLVEVDLTQGDLVMIYGRPKSGKTTTAINYTLHLAKLGHPVTVFNTETVMSGYKYSIRLLAMLMKELANEQEVYGITFSSKIIDKFILFGDEILYDTEQLTRVYWEIYEAASQQLSKLDIDIYDATDGIVDVKKLLIKFREVPDHTIVVLDQINQILDGGADRVSTVLNVLQLVAQVIKEKQLVLLLVSQISTGSSSSITGELPFGGYALIAEVNYACKPMRSGNSMQVHFSHCREEPPFNIHYSIDPESGLILGGRVDKIND